MFTFPQRSSSLFTSRDQHTIVSWWIPLCTSTSLSGGGGKPECHLYLLYLFLVSLQSELCWATLLSRWTVTAWFSGDFWHKPIHHTAWRNYKTEYWFPRAFLDFYFSPLSLISSHLWKGLLQADYSVQINTNAHTLMNAFFFFSRSRAVQQTVDYDFSSVFFLLLWKPNTNIILN